MRTIDMQNWPRLEHFNFFSTFDHPHFSMCVHVDVTPFQPFVKQHGWSLTVAVAYVIARAANAIPEFRQRIRGGQVVEHEVVHPSYSLLVRDDLFGFCTIMYAENFSLFVQRATKSIEFTRVHPELSNDPVRDDMLYMSPIPWVSFTSFEHPMRLQPPDSIPRFAWGRIFSEGQSLKMPLQAQGHHAVMDGIHMGRFFEQAQETLLHPDSNLV
jgi:chloramphenicol O-acetyltransferase type A